MAVYKTGFYSVNGVKMYYDAVANVWSTVAADGTLTPTSLDVNAQDIAGWAEPSVLAGGSFSVTYSFHHIGPADTVHLFVAVGSMSLGTFHMDASWLSPNIAVNNDAADQIYTGTFTLALTGNLATPPVNYSMYIKVLKSTVTDANNYLATSVTYDNAMNFIAGGYTNLAITAVAKVP
jgi:hypothetical protein